MTTLSSLVPRRVNAGNFVAAYTRPELKKRIREERRVVLPVCPLGTSAEQLAALGPLVLPPLWREALIDNLQAPIVERIRECFPYYLGTRDRADVPPCVEVVEVPGSPPARPRGPRVLAFSVDTAVEEHGPHLPLATDTIQSYAVLERLATEFAGFVIGDPVDYGQLTWGLSFGLSIDLTEPLTARYVTGYVNALVEWLDPQAIYVVDVHGSIVHRRAVQAGLAKSRCGAHAFRWLHEPLVEFAGARGDQHAGGVETALVHHVSRELVDARWWPGRIDELAGEQLAVPTAVELSADLARFVAYVESHSLNGIVGDIRNFFAVDPARLMERMLAVARADVSRLLSGPAR